MSTTFRWTMIKAASLGALVLAASVHALVPRTNKCCFELKALGAGGATGTVGQLPDGEYTLAIEAALGQAKANHDILQARTESTAV